MQNTAVLLLFIMGNNHSSSIVIPNSNTSTTSTTEDLIMINQNEKEEGKRNKEKEEGNKEIEEIEEIQNVEHYKSSYCNHSFTKTDDDDDEEDNDYGNFQFVDTSYDDNNNNNNNNDDGSSDNINNHNHNNGEHDDDNYYENSNHEQEEDNHQKITIFSCIPKRRKATSTNTSTSNSRSKSTSELYTQKKHNNSIKFSLGFRSCKALLYEHEEYHAIEANNNNNNNNHHLQKHSSMIDNTEEALLNFYKRFNINRRNRFHIFQKDDLDYTEEEILMENSTVPTKESDLRPKHISIVLHDAKGNRDEVRSIQCRSFHIVTSAALPWMTGTAVNPLLRAAYLNKMNRGAVQKFIRKENMKYCNNNTNSYTEEDIRSMMGSVTLCVPWLIDEMDRKIVYGDSVSFTNCQEQETYIRQWLEKQAKLPLEAYEETNGIRIV